MHTSKHHYLVYYHLKNNEEYHLCASRPRPIEKKRRQKISDLKKNAKKNLIRNKNIYEKNTIKNCSVKIVN